MKKINQFYGWSHLDSLTGRLRRAGRYIVELFLWPHRLMVRTPGFHPGNLSSILGGATIILYLCVISITDICYIQSITLTGSGAVW